MWRGPWEQPFKGADDLIWMSSKKGNILSSPNNTNDATYKYAIVYLDYRNFIPEVLQVLSMGVSTLQLM